MIFEHIYIRLYDCNTEFSDVSPHKNEKKKESKLNEPKTYKKKKPQ